MSLVRMRFGIFSGVQAIILGLWMYIYTKNSVQTENIKKYFLLKKQLPSLKV